MTTSEDSLPRIDMHQHLWSEPLVAELIRRTRPQRVRSTRGGLRLHPDTRRGLLG